jgi:hypothetical protein
MTTDADTNASEAFRRFDSGESDVEEFIDARGIRTFMIRDQDDSRFFRIETENPGGGFSVSATGLRLPPSSRRPKELPKQVPFIAEATTVVMIMPSTGSVVVRWEDPRDPREDFQKTRDSLLQNGWAEEAPASGPKPTKEETGSTLKLEFRKDRTERTLTLFEGQSRSSLVMTEDRVD